MKEFEVQVDVTFSGSLFINANSEEEAIQKAKDKARETNVTRNLVHYSTEIIEVDELGETEDDED